MLPTSNTNSKQCSVQRQMKTCKHCQLYHLHYLVTCYKTNKPYKGEVTVVMPKMLGIEWICTGISILIKQSKPVFCVLFIFFFTPCTVQEAGMSHHGLRCNWGRRGVPPRACQSRRSNGPSCHRHRWRRLLLKKLHHHPKTSSPGKRPRSRAKIRRDTRRCQLVAVAALAACLAPSSSSHS